MNDDAAAAEESGCVANVGEIEVDVAGDLLSAHIAERRGWVADDWCTYFVL